MTKAELEPWQKLEARAKKLETALRAARVKKASHVYQIMTAAAPDEILFQLYHSTFKPVQERMRNYYQKYLPLLQEITPEEWATIEGKRGRPSTTRRATLSSPSGSIGNRRSRRCRKWWLRLRHRPRRRVVGVRQRQSSPAADDKGSDGRGRAPDEVAGARSGGSAGEQLEHAGDQSSPAADGKDSDRRGQAPDQVAGAGRGGSAGEQLEHAGDGRCQPWTARAHARGVTAAGSGPAVEQLENAADGRCRPSATRAHANLSEAIGT